MKDAISASVLTFLLVLPAALLVICTLGLFAGVPIGPWQLPLSALIALLTAGWPRRGTPALWPGVMGGLGVLLLSVALATAVWDTSYDGRAYHSPAALALSDGWNPLSQGSLCAWDEHFCSHPATVYMERYPKAQWIIAAAFRQASGSIEAGKALNLLMLLAVFLYAQRTLGSWPELQRDNATLLAVIIAANPVALLQSYSAYVDGLVASTLSIYALALLQTLRTTRATDLWPALLVLPYLVNLKFSGLVYAGLLGTVTVLAWSWRYRRPPLAPLVACLLVGVLSVAALGFNPYVRNALEKGHPFFPVYTAAGGKSGVVDRQVAPDFAARNRVQKFFIANFSRKASGEGPPRPELRFPLTRLKPNTDAAPRFSGFGPLFSLALAISCLQLPFVRNPLLLASIGGLVISLFITDSGWWARLAPQAWLAVALLQIAMLTRGHRARAIARGMLALLLINSLLLAVYSTVKGVENTREIRGDLAAARAAGAAISLEREQLGYYSERRLEELGVKLERREHCPAVAENPLFSICEGP